MSLADCTTKYQLVQSKPISLEKNIDRQHVLPSDHEDTAENEKWSGPFYFIQAADTQFGLIDRYIKKVENPKWDEENRLSQLLVEKCNKMEPKPSFVVVCGDLVDAMPPETRKQQILDFKRIFSKLDPSIPLVCVCGNHDVGDEPTTESLLDYKQEFGDDYFYFIKGGVLFIVINSQFYKHRANLESYANGQDDWLESVLRKCNLYKYTIVFEHIPWFLKSADEADDYFNIEKSVRLHWLAKFAKAGVSKIMCGHYHRNAGGWHGHMELVITSAVGGQLGDDKSGARIVTISEDKIEHHYYSLEELPEEVNG